MLRLVPLLLLAGCCNRLFSEADYVTRVYHVQDVLDRLHINELALRDRIDMKLSQEGLSADVVDITPQKGILVVHATKQAQERIALFLIEIH